MVTISFEVPPELARQLTPLQDRLPEIVELGLRQLKMKSDDKEKTKPHHQALKQQILTALRSTGIVTIPEALVSTPENVVTIPERPTLPQPRIRYTPLKASGPPASEMIIRERRRKS